MVTLRRPGQPALLVGLVTLAGRLHIRHRRAKMPVPAEFLAQPGFVADGGETAALREGDRVRCERGGEGKLSAGKIALVQEDGAYRVAYDDRT